MAKYLLKRIFDFSAALIGLLLLSPLMLVIAFLIWLTMGPPVIFRQSRPGLFGKPFTIYKFRTMSNKKDEKNNLLPDSMRLTPLGRFLRRTSLDELPELFNVLKGEMSLVGPRPLLMEYMPYYTEREKIRHTVKPGITGWAQINGRNLLQWNERLEMDVWYVENWSIWLDIKILFKTVFIVLLRKGVEVDPRSNMLDLNQERRKNIKIEE